MEKPDKKILYDLLGTACGAWDAMVRYIGEHYDPQEIWEDGRKAGVYACRFRKGGRTLCSLFARENAFGFMVIFGAKERAAFEADRDSYPEEIRAVYDETHQYHDGKWLKFDETDDRHVPVFERLLAIKRKPKK